MNRIAPLLAALALLAGAGPAAALAAGGDRAAATVTVSGRGEVRALPDRATVSLGVSAHAPTVAAARDSVNRVVPALLALAHDLKIADGDLHASELAVSPDYVWNQAEAAQHLTGYAVERRIVLELRDLSRLGELLEKSINAGANVVDGPRLDSSRRADLEREALARAVAEAKRNADVLATATGSSVGPAREVLMGGAQAPREREVIVTASRVSGGGAPASTYSVGEIAFSAEVQVTYELGPGVAAH